MNAAWLIGVGFIFGLSLAATLAVGVGAWLGLRILGWLRRNGF